MKFRNQDRAGIDFNFVDLTCKLFVKYFPSIFVSYGCSTFCQPTELFSPNTKNNFYKLMVLASAHCKVKNFHNTVL